MRRTTVALAIAGALILVPQAAAATVTCGQVLTASTVVDNDLADCAGDGLVVGAPAITVDLNGHTIDGTGNGQGIDNTAGHDDVIVRNGRITQFFNGIYTEGQDRGLISTIFTTENTSHAIWVRNGNGVKVDETTATHSLSGFDAEFTQNVVVDRSNMSDNQIVGVDFNPANTFALVTRTDAMRNGVAGVTFQNGSSDGRADQVYANNNGGNLSNCYCGILVRSARVTVTRSYAVGNLWWGVIVSNESSGSRVERSFANSNGVDGINVAAGANTTIWRNAANSNGNWGIIAGAGNIDAGRNVASGNGIGQCSGVSC